MNKNSGRCNAASHIVAFPPKASGGKSSLGDYCAEHGDACCFQELRVMK